jgi:hypothetical protein
MANRWERRDKKLATKKRRMGLSGRGLKTIKPGPSRPPRRKRKR